VEPVYKGGGDVRLVSREFIEWSSSPAKDEAGTPNILGVVALISAINTINAVGMNMIREHEKKLINYLIAGLKNIQGVQLYGHHDENDERVSIIAFNIEGLYHHLLAKMLSIEAGIGVRSGLFCAHPYVEKLLKLSREEMDYYHHHHELAVPGLVRVSLALYNQYHEIDILLEVLDTIVKNKSYYINQYGDHVPKGTGLLFEKQK
jgi:selenocysteine lyase/cysteine desulfurase